MFLNIGAIKHESYLLFLWLFLLAAVLLLHSAHI